MNRTTVIVAIIFCIIGIYIGSASLDYMYAITKHQTFIIGIGGGGAIFLRFLANDWQKRNEIIESKRAIAACLHYEIHHNSGCLYNTLNTISDDHDFTSTLIIDTQFFDANLCNLGCLDSSTVYNVAQFYGYTKTTNAALDAMYKNVGSTPVKDLTDLQKEYIKTAKHAIRTFLGAATLALPPLAKITGVHTAATLNKIKGYTTEI